MQHQSISKTISTAALFCSLILAGCSGGEEPAAKTAAAKAPVMSAEEIAALGNVIARVGDQDITFNQINTMLNSSAVVGVSVPALGTPERDTARIVVLDKVISANLLYLDAQHQGVDKDPAYQRELRDFSNGMLANLYHRRFLAGEGASGDRDRVRSCQRGTLRNIGGEDPGRARPEESQPEKRNHRWATPFTTSPPSCVSRPFCRWCSTT